MRTAAIGMAAIGWIGLALAGCAHHRGSGGHVPRGGETITYSTERCFGACPVYSVTVGPDGQGIFNGEQFTAARGEHRFQLTPEQARAFANSLSKARPRGERVLDPSSPDCGPSATDMPSVAVRWQGAGGVSSLRFYYGCAARNRDLAHTLRAAPGLLPIGTLIGQR